MTLTEVRRLFSFLLFLLTDTNLKLLLLGFLERLVVVPGNGVSQIGIDVGIAGQNRHQSISFVASRAKRPKALYIRDRHRSLD